MSKEIRQMREQIDKVKNYKQFLNESKADKMADSNTEIIGAIRKYAWRLFTKNID